MHACAEKREPSRRRRRVNARLHLSPSFPARDGGYDDSACGSPLLPSSYDYQQQLSRPSLDAQVREQFTVGQLDTCIAESQTATDPGGHCTHLYVDAIIGSSSSVIRIRKQNRGKHKYQIENTWDMIFVRSAEVQLPRVPFSAKHVMGDHFLSALQPRVCSKHNH